MLPFLLGLFLLITHKLKTWGRSLFSGQESAVTLGPNLAKMVTLFLRWGRVKAKTICLLFTHQQIDIFFLVYLRPTIQTR